MQDSPSLLQAVRVVALSPSPADSILWEMTRLHHRACSRLSYLIEPRLLPVRTFRKQMDNTPLWRRSLMDIFNRDEGTLSVARSTDNLDAPSDQPRLQNRAKSGKRPSIVRGHFPKLAECAHFHYENVDFRTVQLALSPQPGDASWNGLTQKESVFLVQVLCQGKNWLVRRSYEDFQTLDSHLHQCIFDRGFSQLPELPTSHTLSDNTELVRHLLMKYLARLTSIADNKINCGPVLTWMEIDNKGNRLLVNDESFINVPAIAAAQVIKRYTAQASDELSFQVGDIVSVIDMPPKEDTTWWRGKNGFQVGFFPSECVQLINERLPSSNSTITVKADSEAAGANPGTSPPSPTSVCKKHGKLMGLLLNFMKSRPSRQKLKQRGILRERVFGCDLGEHLLNSGLDVPQVLKSCSEFIEEHGIVDGIYRLSGISSNIQKLRPPSEAVCLQTLDEKILKVHDVIQQLPPPNYRTLQFLMRHLAKLAKQSSATNMHWKNLAIVWAPNLLRSKEIELVGFSGTDAFREVRIQSVVVEFLLRHVDILFSDKFSSAGKDSAGHNNLIRPKSIWIPSLSSRLLSLEEAQARTLAQGKEGTGAVYEQLHPINPATDRRREGGKMRKTGAGAWKSFFTTGKVSGASRRKSQTEVFDIIETNTGAKGETVTLRSVKSEESLTSQQSRTDFLRIQNVRHHRSSSDAVSMSVLADARDLSAPCSSSASSEGAEAVYVLPGFQLQPLDWPEEDQLEVDSELGPGWTHKLPPSPALHTASKPVTFTRKLAPAFSPRGARPLSHGISPPLAITVPASVLEMLGSPAGEAQAQNVSAGQAPAQIISRLLRTGDFQRSNLGPSEQQSKMAASGMEVKGQLDSPGQEDSLSMQNAQEPVLSPTKASLAVSPSQSVPPPPPPKNAARLMALSLMEQAHLVSRTSILQGLEHQQLSPVQQDHTGVPSTASLLVEQYHIDSSLYSTINPLKRGSARTSSPSSSEIGPRYHSHKLTTQVHHLSPSLVSAPHACRDANVMLTQSLRGPIAHSRVEHCIHPLPLPAPSSCSSHHSSVPWSHSRSPLDCPACGTNSPSPPRRPSVRPGVRCLSVAALLTLPPPPPRPTPPPLITPQLLEPSPCCCGVSPESQPLPTLMPRPPAFQSHPSALPLGQRTQTMGPETSFEPPKAWQVGWIPDASESGIAMERQARDSEVYAEIVSDGVLCQCGPPCSVRPGPTWSEEAVPCPLPSYRDARQTMVSADDHVLPTDPLLPDGPLLLQPGAKPHRPPLAFCHQPPGLEPYTESGRVRHSLPEAPLDQVLTCAGLSLSPELLDPSPTPGLSPRLLTQRHLPEATYVNVPVFPCWAAVSAGRQPAPPQQPARGKTLEPQARCSPTTQAAPMQRDSPVRRATVRHPPYRHGNPLAGLEGEGARGLEMVHPRSQSDPVKLEKVSAWTGSNGSPQAAAKPQWPSSYTMGSALVLPCDRQWEQSRPKQRRQGHWCPTEGSSQRVHPALRQQVRAPRVPALASTLHANGQRYRPRCSHFPSGELLLNPYSPGPDCGGVGHCLSTLMPTYQDVLVTYDKGQEARATVTDWPPVTGGRTASGKESREDRPYDPLPRPRPAYCGPAGHPSTVAVAGCYGNLPAGAPLPLYQLCRARAQRLPAHCAARDDRLERSFC
ncbi:rho GTPase-activating protein 33-like [Heterodontus francisci]|uniref:rho GTPase-activating protein 33-like n=1 Tax=Heterodontus francisci TaxID=7792 RepID=UPI00355C9A15